MAEAAALAAEGTSPASDLPGQADYRRHLARVLTAGGYGGGSDGDAR